METVPVDERDRELLQWLQDEFPVTERPWLSGGRTLGMTEEEVLSRVLKMYARGIIRSVHTILDRQKAGSGCSTLVAMRVSKEKIPDTVAIINGYPSVTHNYLREYEFNLWFTVNAKDEKELKATTDEMVQRTGVADTDLLDLRTRQVFRIDVRFRFSNAARIRRNRGKPVPVTGDIDETDRALMRITQQGIPLVEEPFRKIGGRLSIGQGEVLERLGRLLRQGIIKRIGGSVNQRKIGIVANAVVVWRVQDDLVTSVGNALASYDEVTHCYERRTVPGVWEYNLFTVLHGYDFASVEACAKRLSEAIGISDYKVIFSTEEFKKTSVVHEVQTIHPKPEELHDPGRILSGG